MKINLSHGNGGQETAKLINDIFLKHFKNDLGSAEEDSAILNTAGNIAFTTDSFVVRPIFFSGGDIGRLAVCGTVNDLLTSGSIPKYLSAGFIIEEGFEIEHLDKIAGSMKEAAMEAGIFIVTGDTKVIDGNGGIYINTSGIGILADTPISFKSVEEGDSIILTGSLGDHHACITSARMGIKNNIKSDTAPLNSIVRSLQANKVPLHGIRDITRGGLATCLNEISGLCGLQANIYESLLPINSEVAGLCSILGLDTLYMANEGKMLIAVPNKEADNAVKIIKSEAYGKQAAIIGEFKQIEQSAKKSKLSSSFSGGRLIMTTKIGGKRILSPLTGESLPRIC